MNVRKKKRMRERENPGTDNVTVKLVGPDWRKLNEALRDSK